MSYRFKPDPMNNGIHHVLDYIEDLNGNRVTVNYTGALITSVTSSTGDTWQFAYNGDGHVIQSIDEVGRITTYSYVPFESKLVSITNSTGTTSFTYASYIYNAVQSITYPDGTHLYFEYDSMSRVTKQYRDGNAETVTFAYDTTGEITVIDALGNTTHILPTDQGQIGQITDPLGAIIRLSYDQDRNLAQIVEPYGAIYSFGYDAQDNLNAATDPLENRQSFSYGAYGTLQSLTDGLGNVLRYGYDNHYNNNKITYPDNSMEWATYDSRGNQVEWKNRRGRSIGYTYDSHDLVTRKAYADASQVNYSYDSHRNLVSITNPAGTTGFTYDGADRLTGISYPNGRSLQYTYDNGGRRSSLSDQTGFIANYAYDAAGRLSRLSDGSNATIVAYAYDDAGRLERKTLGNGTYTVYAYDPAGNIHQVANYASSDAGISSYTYVYDLLGRKTRMTAPDGVYSYGYDATGQLTSVSLPDGGAIQYTYDRAGNRITAVTSGVTTAYVINNLNEYLSAGGASFTYDTDGNLVSKSGAGGTWQYIYDDEGRLVSTTGPGVTWTYEYDALGSLVGQTRNGARTEYLVDPTGLGDVIAEFNGSGTLLAHYTYGLDLASRVSSGGGAAYYHFDGSGNTVLLTGSAGAVLNSYSFLPFGEKVNSSEAVSNPFTFVGQFGVRDEGNSLYYMRNRWYDPALGRFTGPDPLGIDGGDTNLYSYVSNGVPNLMDPLGLKPKPIRDTVDRYKALKDAEGQHNDVTGLVEGGKRRQAERERQRDSLTNPNGTDAKQPETLGDVKTLKEAQDLAMKQVEKLYQLEKVKKLIKAGETAKAAYKKGFKKVIKDLPKNINKTIDDTLSEPIADYYRIKGWIKPYIPYNTTPEKTKKTQVPSAHDPNMKVTVGYGTGGYIVGDTPILFTIDFENVSSATAAAQKVVITDQLDANLDWSSFQLVQIGFNNTTINIAEGLQRYTAETTVPNDPNPVQVSASLNPSTGLITWTMQSVDPVTGGVPADPYAGFLPPNDATHRGEGFVSFTVMLKPGLASGTAIANTATIVFDVNTPMTTNETINTIDEIAPTSSVAALPSTTSQTSFTVSWTGSDNAGGSGIALFDVYVSIDGGPFALWRAATTETSAVASGEVGHSYGFYSIATDNVGNRQSTPAGAQATTTLTAGGCTYSISPGGHGFSWNSGANSFAVITTPADCPWTATTTDSWITILAGSGTGDGTVNYSVSVNGTGQSRKGTIAVGGLTFTVRQAESEFTDVPEGHWAQDFIYSMVVEGVTAGCSSNDYCADIPVTRSMMAVFIESALGLTPGPACQGGVFYDVNVGSVGEAFCRFIEDFADRGITGGCGNGNYCPDNAVTRSQMAVFIEVALGISPVPACSETIFGDVSEAGIGAAFCGFIEDFANRGITGGCGNGNYCPDNPVTRAQMAIFLGKAFLGM